MNAKSERASLPDRVEAAARVLAEDFGPLPWDDAPAEDKHWRYLQAERVLAVADACEAERAIDAAHLERQREWSLRTFGPGPRTGGVTDHIRKELTEIEAAPDDVGEWVDVIILAFDGAWRTGAEPQSIIDAIKAKQAKNEQRDWPDWRTAPTDRAIEHVREAERNPNTTDDGRYAYLCEVCNDQPWWRIERADAAVTWACSEHLSTACLRLVRVGYRDALTIAETTPVVDSRPVSSEDVHREAAE